MDGNLVNANPTVYNVVAHTRGSVDGELDDSVEDPIDSLELFELLRGVRDPEHPNTLEQLKVIEVSGINVDAANERVKIRFTPTVPHCSMTTLIGLCLRVKLMRTIPPRFKVDIRVSPGTHNQELSVNKQLNDKERVAAALENAALLRVVNSCLRPLGRE
eukprot:PhM_4_TR4565/c0_g1_i1/m.3908